MEDAVKVILDIGMGAVAFQLTRQLSAVVKSLQALTAEHQSRLNNHEGRITKLEAVAPAAV